MQTRNLLAAVFMAVPITGISQEEAVEQELMVVTASRGEETISEALVSVSVITSEDIERSVAEDLTDQILEPAYSRLSVDQAQALVDGTAAMAAALGL